MSRKQIFIIAGLVLLVVFILILGKIMYKPIPAPAQETGIDILEKKNASSTTTTVAPVTFSPEVPKNATATTPSESAHTATGNMFGIYPISATKNGFEPNSIVVKKGDVVKLQLTAMDAKYDLTLQGYGNYIVAEQGAMSKVSFIPDTVGTFLFECRDFCPASGKIQGTLIVLPK